MQLATHARQEESVPKGDKAGVYLEQYMTKCRQIDLLDKDGMIEKGRNTHACLQRMLAELSQSPAVLQRLVDIHRIAQEKRWKVGSYALSVGDHSVASMDRVLRANDCSSSDVDPVVGVQYCPDAVVAQLDELDTHFSVFLTSSRGSCTRSRALDRAAACFRRLELKWTVLDEIIELFKETMVIPERHLLCALELLGAATPSKALGTLRDISCEHDDLNVIQLLRFVQHELDLDDRQIDVKASPVRHLMRLEESTQLPLARLVACRVRFDAAEADRAQHVARITEHNLLLVARFVRKMGILEPDEQMECIQEGNDGLIIASQRFKYWLGRRFSTIAAHWIKRSIFKSRKLRMQSFDIPCSVESTNFDIARARKQLQQDGVPDPSYRQLAEKLGISLDRVQNAQAVFFEAERDELTINTLSDTSDLVSGEHALYTEQRGQIVREALAELSHEQRSVCVQRFGIGTGEPRSLEQISRDMRMSCERIRNIERSAIKTLLYGPHGRRIKSLVDNATLV